MSIQTQTWEAQTAASRRLAEQARRMFPDGVSSPVRGGRAFDPYPFYVARGEGAYLVDEDGNRYVDTVMGFGPVILGHAHPEVTSAVKAQAERGLLYGTCTALEVEVAERIRAMVPSAELIRFVPSGTEATMHAIRVARGFTGKPKILKFEGHYHGNHDQVLVSITPPLEAAGHERDPVKIPAGSGIPEAAYAHTLLAVWNDLEAIERLIRCHRHELAAIISEPVMANKGFIPADPGYLQALQRLCKENDVMFILDEVITGFRMAPGGAQEVWGLQPDLSTFAKAMANGAPMGAFAGRREVMNVLEDGKVRHAGTYNASPICLAAARATLDVLRRSSGAAYTYLRSIGEQLMGGLRDIAARLDLPVLVQGAGSMLQIYFTHHPSIRTYRQALAADRALFSRFAHGMIRRGIFVHPDNFEHWFLSLAHTDREIAVILEGAEAVLRDLKAEGAIGVRTKGKSVHVGTEG
jgi:glutamate-1-semialdehyde 2,1-aminomutase